MYLETKIAPNFIGKIILNEHNYSQSHARLHTLVGLHILSAEVDVLVNKYLCKQFSLNTSFGSRKFGYMIKECAVIDDIVIDLTE